MRKTITTIITLAAMLFATNANAQKEFVYEFSSICGESYENYTQVLDVDAIEAELGCTLAEANIYAVQSDGTLDADYTLGPGGTTTDGWRNADGDWEVWSSSGSCFCVKANFTPEPDENGNVAPHIYYIGGKSGQTASPVTYKATYRLENPDNSKYCFVIVKLSYEEMPEYNVNELTIVKKFDFVAEQFPRANTAYETYALQVGDLASLIGYDADKFMLHWYKRLMYVGQLDENEMKSDVLTNLNYSSSAWMNALFDDNTGNETEECVQGTSGDMTKFRVHFSSSGYDGDSLKIQIGQSGKLKVGDTNFVKLYFVGPEKKAVELDVRIKIIPKEIVDLPWAEKTCVGSQTISFVRDILLGYTPVDVVTINMDSIVSLFKPGTVAADLVFTALDENGEPTTGYTTGEGTSTAAGGFWLDMESHPIGWNTSVKSYYVNNYTTRLEIGHMPSVFDGGEKTSGSLFYALDNEYYELKMDIQIGEAEDTTKVITEPQDCEIVATKYYTYKMVPNTAGQYQDYGSDVAGERDYHLMDRPIDADIDFIEAQLGTASPIFYGEVIDEEGNATYSKSWSCTPYPGFWMAPASDQENKSTVSTWNGTNSYGICYANGVFQFFQYPGVQSVGAKFTDNFYLVNQEAGKQMKFVITVLYVEEIQPEAETLKTFTLSLPARDASDKDNGAYTAYDLTPMYEAFGCTPEEFEENGTWMALDENGVLSSNYDELEGFAFDKDAKITTDDEALVAMMGYIAEESAFFSWVIDDSNLTKTYTFTIYAYYNNQRCEFTITIDPAAAINFVEAKKENSNIYDLTGRLVKNAATSGIYLKDGKKFFVK